MYLTFGYVDFNSGVPKCLLIYPVCQPCIVIVFTSDCIVKELSNTITADIRRFIKPYVTFKQIFTGLIADGKRSVFSAVWDEYMRSLSETLYKTCRML